MIKRISILGGGNIGKAIAIGLLRTGLHNPESIIVTRRNLPLLKDLAEKGIKITSDNRFAVENADLIIIAVRPQQVEDLLKEVGNYIKSENHLLASVVPSYNIDAIARLVDKSVSVIRVMPNLAISVNESITCLAANIDEHEKLEEVQSVFNQMGKTVIIDEQLMPAATVLGACGIAFFLRTIRAISQGGIQIGFHAEEAQLIAAQTSKGASALLIDSKNHPEKEIDKVTTPRGITIAGLNEMDHRGLNSALIKGIMTSFNEISNSDSSNNINS